MIPFDQMDQRLQKLGKTRAWLETVTPYKGNSIRQALAPSGGARGARIQKILSDAIELEEARQKKQKEKAAATPPALGPGLLSIFQTDEELARADAASRQANFPSLADFIRAAIAIRADEILEAEKKAGTKKPALAIAKESIADREERWRLEHSSKVADGQN